jgi:hypothetical protein
MAKAKPAKPTKPPAGFLTAAELSVCLDWSVSYFNQNIRPHLAEDDKATVSRRSYFRVRSVVDILVERATKAATPPVPQALAPLEARAAAAKAEREEINTRLAALEEERRLEERAVRHGELIEADDLTEQLGHIADRFRRFGERVEQKKSIPGQAVTGAINAILEQLEAEARAIRQDSLASEPDE